MRTLLVNDETQEMYDVTEMIPKLRKRWSKHFGFPVTTEETINVLLEEYKCNRYMEVGYEELIV